MNGAPWDISDKFFYHLIHTLCAFGNENPCCYPFEDKSNGQSSLQRPDITLDCALSRKRIWSSSWGTIPIVLRGITHYPTSIGEVKGQGKGLCGLRIRMVSSSLPITRRWGRVASRSWARDADFNDKHMDLDTVHLSFKTIQYQCDVYFIDNGIFCNDLLLSTYCSGIYSLIANNQRDHWLLKLLSSCPVPACNFFQLILEAKAGHHEHIPAVFVCVCLLGFLWGNYC